MSTFVRVRQMTPNLGATVLRDLDIDGLVAGLPTYTTVGAAALKERLSTPIDDEAELTRRQDEIRAIRSRGGNIKALREQLRDNEENTRTVAEAATEVRHAEYYTQILWPTDSRFAWLNKIGWLNELIIAFRTLLLPALSVILPLLVLVAPFIFFHLVAKQPLTCEGYLGMLKNSMNTVMPSVLGKPRFAGRGGIAEMGEQCLHIGVAITMFVASIWNQISAAMSMRAVVVDMRSRAQSVTAFTEATRSLATVMGVPLCPSLQTPWSVGDLGVFGHAWNEPERVREILAFGGHLDMLATLATAKRTCFPTVSASSLTLSHLYHPGVPRKERVYNSITLGPHTDASGQEHLHNHVLLTGPNRGGKSTLLKSIGIAVLMSHTVGIVFAKEASVPRFTNIITALAPQDVVGKLSLFEAEIEFAKEVKGLLGPKTFLMMDEIFHGTNAHDGVEASQVFLDDVYTAKNKELFSIVSTHYMNLPERYAQVQHLCMGASVSPTDPDRLVYTYKVSPGVNRFSSVREILQERGLLMRRCGSAD